MLQRLDIVKNQRECALSVDFTVRSGTANVFTKQQNFRASWIGQSLSTTNIYLAANGGSHRICNPFSIIILNCEYPVRLSYIDPSTGMLVQHTVNQLWISDASLDGLTIENASNIENAVVVTTMQTSNNTDDGTSAP